MVLRVVTSHHVWLYIKCVVILYTPAFHSTMHRRLYTWLCVTVRGYTCIFTLKAVLQHSHFTMWLHAWLYHFMCGYTLNTWLYTFIYTLTFHCTACGYTRGYASRYTVIPVISRIYTYIHVIYTYVIVPYIVSLFQHRSLCLITAFSKYVSTLFYTYICTYTVIYQTT